MTARFRRRLGSVNLAKRGSLLGVAVLATGLAAKVVRTRLRSAPNAEVARPTPAGSVSPPATTRRTVAPKAGGGWVVRGGRGSREYRTKAEAEQAARSELLASGGGELVVKGKNGKVRDQTTVGKAAAVTTAPTHKGAAPNKGADGHKGAAPNKVAEGRKSPDASKSSDPHNPEG